VPVSLSANVWFGVEFALVVSGSAGSERVFLNGVEQSGLTRVNVDNDGGGAVDNCVSVGVNGWDTNVMGQGGVNWAFSMYVDDVRVTTTTSDPPGNAAPTYSNVGYSSSVAGSSSVFSCFGVMLLVCLFSFLVLIIRVFGLMILRLGLVLRLLGLMFLRFLMVLWVLWWVSVVC